MKLQDQVCTLEQAKRLRELGVSQQAEWHWRYDPSVPRNKPRLWHRSVIHVDDEHCEKPAAFTVAELGLMMGTEVYTERKGTATSQYANWDWVGAENVRGPFSTEAEARADFLIKMLEIEMYTAEEVNKWLEA